MRFWRFLYQNCSTTTSSMRWEPGQQEIPRRPWTQIYQLQKEKTTVRQPNPSGFNQISFFWYSNNVLGFLHELQDCRGSQQQLLRASRPQLQQPGRRWFKMAAHWEAPAGLQCRPRWNRAQSQGWGGSAWCRSQPEADFQTRTKAEDSHHIAGAHEEEGDGNEDGRCDQVRLHWSFVP